MFHYPPWPLPPCPCRRWHLVEQVANLYMALTACMPEGVFTSSSKLSGLTSAPMALTSAPFSSRSLQTSIASLLAMLRGPFITLAPRSDSSLQISSWPCSLATYSGVTACSAWLTLAPDLAAACRFPRGRAHRYVQWCRSIISGLVDISPRSSSSLQTSSAVLARDE